MKKSDLQLMAIDELWALHEAVAELLTRKITAEKRELEERLKRLSGGSQIRIAEVGGPRERRPYPRVLPKYRNPLQPGESWSGRGKKPRWLVTQLKSGHKMEEFRIGEDELQELQGSRARAGRS
jgi:DNA-binding protein H-NS